MGKIQHHWFAGFCYSFDFFQCAAISLAGWRAQPGPKNPDEKITIINYPTVNRLLWSDVIFRGGMGFPPERKNDDAAIVRMKVVPVLYYTDSYFMFFRDVRRRCDENSVHASIIRHWRISLYIRSHYR